MDALKLIAQDSLKAEAPKLNVGDTVKVHVRIAEGDKFRIQIFEGTVIAKKHGGVSETFTVRRVSYGVGVEKTWPVHSPRIDHIELVKKGIVRRAKLYYLRDRVGKAAKTKEQIGARIENKEITVKTAVEEPVAEEVKAEATVAEETTKTEE